MTEDNSDQLSEEKLNSLNLISDKIYKREYRK